MAVDREQWNRGFASHDVETKKNGFNRQKLICLADEMLRLFQNKVCRFMLATCLHFVNNSRNTIGIF